MVTALTPDQQDATYWLSEGYSHAEIAEELEKDLHCVKAILMRARKSLGAKTEDELIVKAIMHGVVKKQFGNERPL